MDLLPRVFFIAERNLDMVQVNRGSRAGESKPRRVGFLYFYIQSRLLTL